MYYVSCTVYYPGQHVGVLTLFSVSLFFRSKKAILTSMVPQLLLSGSTTREHQTFCFGYVHTWHELKWLLDTVFTAPSDDVNRVTAQICSVSQTKTCSNIK
jgi:hypothetical protein